MRPKRVEPILSVDEYLDRELSSEVRHEYLDGEVYAMVGASDRHGLITLNLAGALSLRLPECCQVFASDMKARVQTAEREIFYYRSARCALPACSESGTRDALQGSFNCRI